MSLLIVYAIAITLGALWCAGGWYFAHSSLVALADVEQSEWPQIRALLRDKILKLRRPQLGEDKK